MKTTIIIPKCKLFAGVLALMPFLLTPAAAQIRAVDWGSVTYSGTSTVSTDIQSPSSNYVTASNKDYDFSPPGNDKGRIFSPFDDNLTYFFDPFASGYVPPTGKTRKIHAGVQAAAYNTSQTGPSYLNYTKVTLPPYNASGSGAYPRLLVSNAAYSNSTTGNDLGLGAVFYSIKSEFLNDTDAVSDLRLTAATGSLTLTTGSEFVNSTAYFAVKASVNNSPFKWYISATGATTANSTLLLDGYNANWYVLPVDPSTNLFLNTAALGSPIFGSSLANIQAIGVYCLKPHFNAGAANASVISIAGFRADLTPTWESFMDFFVQDVCLNSSGQVLMGVSPISSSYNPATMTRRDMRTTDRISYYTVSTLPNAGQLPGADHGTYPDGYWRTAHIPYSFPAYSPPYTSRLAAIRYFDSQKNSGETWGGLDYADTAMRTMWVQSDITISYGAVSDFSGPTLYNGELGQGGVNATNPAVRLDAGITVGSSIISQVTGSMIGFSPGSDGTTTHRRSWVPEPLSVPMAQNTYEWSLERKIYTTNFGQQPTVYTAPLLSLISHQVPTAAAVHNERTYYTRELGYTRHETWKKLGTGIYTAAQETSFKTQAAALKTNGVCADYIGTTGLHFEYRVAPPPAPDESATIYWICTTCFENTDILSPDDMTNGDDPQPWINLLKVAPLYAPLFGTTANTAPVITGVSPLTVSLAANQTVTITGSNFGTRNAILFNRGRFVAKATGNSTQLTFTLPPNFVLDPVDANNTFKVSVYNDVPSIAHSTNEWPNFHVNP